ncbi:MAG: 3-dehydroquinate synthase [Chthoniobacterales bacterium]|nr:3-dehydroquinate synthase [Chthoniobacterales bacterium]
MGRTCGRIRGAAGAPAQPGPFHHRRRREQESGQISALHPSGGQSSRRAGDAAESGGAGRCRARRFRIRRVSTADCIEVPVKIPGKSCRVLVGAGLIARAGELVNATGLRGSCAIITDENVGRLHGAALQAALEKTGCAALLLAVPAGETSKCLAAAENLCDRMIAAGLDRGSFVVALGGGVVGDLAGFVAAIYQRGIPFVQIPTTIVAQVDSSIGGKTGVNARAGKNLIGAFHQPSLVLADTATLVTLPGREYQEGFAEVIKHAVIRDAAMLGELDPGAPRESLAPLIARNIAIKAAIVADDEREQTGTRALLNFGHTVAHAIENVAGYGRYLHGEAVSLGMAAALEISTRKYGLPAADAGRVRTKLAEYGLPLTLPADLETGALLAAARHDKKFSGGNIRYVVCPRIGEVFVADDVTEHDIRAAIDSLRE